MKNIRRFSKILLILSFVFCLSSCFNMKIDLNFDKKSGKLTMEYDVNDEYFQLLSIVMSNVQLGEDVFFDPFVLLDEQQFKSFFNGLPKESLSDITLFSVSIKRNQTTGYYKGKIVFLFKDFEKCMAMIPQGVAGLTFTKDNGTYTIGQTVDMKKMDAENMLGEFINTLKEDDEDFYKLLTEKAEFNFAVQLRSKIRKSEGVHIGKDGMSASYGFKINDLLATADKPLQFMIEF